MKKKRLLSIICASALLTMNTGGYIPTIPAVSSTSVTASAAEDISEVKEGPLTFRVYSDYAEVSECARSCKGVIVIPDEINGVPVMSIGGQAFSECEQITSVIIPDSVFKIGYCSFSSCKELATVKIPDSVSVIGSNAFNDTKWLTAKREEDPLVIVNGILIDGKTCSGDVIIPDSVTGINDNAFTACKEITSVVIPDSVKEIGYEAFAHCTNLTSVSIPDSITSIAEWAFYKSGLISVNIPDSVTRIGESAFNFCNKLETVTIPDSVEYIGYLAFDDTEWMSSQQTEDPLVIVNGILINGKACKGDLIIPDSVTSIAEGAFIKCETLTSVTIPDSVKSIGRFAFQNCIQLEKVAMADSVTEMDEYVFIWCSSLTSVKLSSSLKSIKTDTFYSCEMLNEIDIPASVSSIGDGAFLGCKTLKKITINNPNCDIFDQGDTISTEYDNKAKQNIFDGEIWGYSGSTAQKYAEKYGYVFKALSNVSGDLNGDGAFNVSDVVLLQKWLLAVPDTNIVNWEAADLCKDGRLDVFDLCLAKQELIQKMDVTYVEPDERYEWGVPFYVVKDGLKLYSGPDESYDVIASIPADTHLNESGVKKNNNTWLFTEYNGQCGWINTLDKDGKMVIHFEEATKKPVIYLYPEKETDVHVELELTESELNTTYPKYNNGWDVTAYPDGTLLNKADSTHHKYLFWDAVNCRTRFDFSEGFCVAGGDTEAFLKGKLTYMGLTEQEMNEFIVYWLPLMEHNAYNLISFQDEAYTNTAKLTITPAPDSECRVFMAYVPLENAVDIESQQLSAFERKGFSVVEWGGAEVRYQN